MKTETPTSTLPEPTAVPCPRCATRLAVEEVPGVNIALCPACRHSFTLRPFVDKRKTSRKAILSLWLGIGTLLFACLTGVPAALVGAVALYEISRNEERLKGRRLAVAGIAMGIFFSFLCTPVVLVVIAAFIDTIRKG